MRMSPTSRALTLVAVFAVTSPLTAGSITVVPDDLFAGKMRWIVQLMPDGRSLMGVAGDEVFRWTKDEGRTTIGYLGPYIIPTAISGDGTTVVGRRLDGGSQNAIRWTKSRGTEILPPMPGFPNNPSATHVSDDGNFVYGIAQTIFEEPIFDLYMLGQITFPDFPDIGSFDNRLGVFRWDTMQGTQVLPEWSNVPMHGFQDRSFQAISADGRVTAGKIGILPAIQHESSAPLQPVIDTQNFGGTGVVEISADGSTMVGTFYGRGPLGGTHAFRWKQGDSFQPLTDMTESYSTPYAVSGNGQIVLGDNGNSIFVWEEGQGQQKLDVYFANHGVILPFAGVHAADQMSRDGLSFHGYSTEAIIGSNGLTTVRSIQWIVDLSVPEPASAFLLTIGLAFQLTYRGRMRPQRKSAD